MEVKKGATTINLGREIGMMVGGRVRLPGSLLADAPRYYAVLPVVLCVPGYAYDARTSFRASEPVSQ
jgi:hypothetical protein